jgi:hypothetical protein
MKLPTPDGDCETFLPSRLGWSLILAGWTAWAGAGCSSTGPSPVATPRGPDEPIEEINMFSAPAALNFDGIPGPDGLSLRIYAANSREPKGLALGRGKLEILMFDGLVKPEEVTSASPLHVWSYPAKELVRHSQKTSIGISYVLTPVWGADKPAKNRVTVLARYTTSQGRQVWSGPTVVAVPGN